MDGICTLMILPAVSACRLASLPPQHVSIPCAALRGEGCARRMGVIRLGVLC